jgi:TDG/mug DNA glycosylase family protein
MRRAACDDTRVTGHRVIVNWMGSEVETLADLLPAHPRAVCVGINPAPTSVAVGHYYQGPQGQRFFARLIQATLLQPIRDGFEDDAAVASGIGFTDVVKRPTPRADQVMPDELRHGRELLERKLSSVGRPPLIFSFKAAAVALVGTFDGNGWLEGTFAGCRLFVLPGPYEKHASAESTIATLAPQLC